jgi:nucleoside-diphosphate-sugar epimerase
MDFDLINQERIENRAELKEDDSFIICPDDPILITGATGFIGHRLVKTLLDLGFRDLRCLTRGNNLWRLKAIEESAGARGRVVVVTANLQSREDCLNATREAAVIFHLAAARGEKSFPDAFMNSVVTTRNLLEATLRHRCLRRFVNVSSFVVYASPRNPRGTELNETCAIEMHPELRGEAYCFAKVRQDEIVTEYGGKFGIPYVIVRPGYVYGPGSKGVSGRVGIDTFGVFLHLGGSNTIPLTFVDNCADAIALAGLKRGIDGQVFNVVDDDLPSSRHFLRLYKRQVKHFKSLYVPHSMSYSLCYLWEKYSTWSRGQLPPAFNRKKWHAYWKKTCYSNEKLKRLVGWAPRVPTPEGLRRYFESCRNGELPC